VPRAVVKLPDEKGFGAWKERLLKELREKSFRAFPEEIPPARPKGGGRFISEPGIEVEALPAEQSPEPQTLVVFDRGIGGIDDKSSPDWRSYLKGSNYRVLAPRGVVDGGWTKKSPPNYVERAHALLGRTVDEGRVWDVIAVVKRLQQGRKEPIRVIGLGQAGVLVAYAALLEPSLQDVVLIDPPASHRQGPIFLNVLRVLDVPDALGLLAPRPLTLVNAKDRAFDRTAEIYKLAGAADRLRRK
jgi:hypothetical protein